MLTNGSLVDMQVLEKSPLTNHEYFSSKVDCWNLLHS
jgi:hypothetical protein